MANPRKLLNGKWMARFPAPSRHRKVFDTKKQADAALTKARDQRNEGTYIAPRAIPIFRTAAEEWFAAKMLKRHPATLAQYRTHLDCHLLPKFGALKLDRIDPEAVECFRDELQRPPKELNPATVRKIATNGSAIFKRAIRLKRCQTNPFALAERAEDGAKELAEDDADRPQHEDGAISEDEVFNLDEIRALLAAAAPGFSRTLIMTAALTGLRIGELTALRWSDIELDARKICVRRALTWARVPGEAVKGRFYKPKTKNSRRAIPISVELAGALRRWKLQCPPGELVFPTADGQPMHRTAATRLALDPALRRAGLRRLGFHSLRHSFASVLLADNTNVVEVAGLLGHKNATITLKVYAHWLRRTESTSVDKLAKAARRWWTLSGHCDRARRGKHSDLCGVFGG